MSYYLIGIGGTGARCLEAFVNINGAGLLNDNQEIKLIYVDADKSYLTLWDEKNQKIISVFGSLPPSYDESNFDKE